MLQIKLSLETEEILVEQARQHGEDAAAYGARILHKALTTPTVDELLAPFRQENSEGGATDDEMDSLFEEARNEVWSDGQAKKAQGS